MAKQESTKLGIPTHISVPQQLQDVITAQKESYERLRIQMEQQSCDVSREDYDTVLQKLEDEQLAHASTKSRLMEVQDQLEFAHGEIEVLQKEIARQKIQFDKTFGLMKNRAVSDTMKSVQLETQCHAIARECEQRDDALSDKSEEVDTLEQKLQATKESLRVQQTEAQLQRQQEIYIAQLMNEHDSKRNRTHRKTVPRATKT